MKKICLPLIAASLFALASSCAGKTETAGDPAQSLFDQAGKAIESNDFEQACLLLDSLDSSCKEAVDIRRQAMPLRARAIEGLSLQQIPVTDENIARVMMEIDSLGKSLSDAGDKSDPYVVPKGWPRRGDIKAEGVEPRVDRKGFFRLIVKSPGKVIDLNSVEIKGGDGSSAATASLPSDRVAKVEGMELMSISQEEFAPVGTWLEAHRGTAATLVIVGSRGRKEQKFSSAQTAMLLDAWLYSKACQRLVEEQLERERLERQLKIARDQMARI